MPKRSINRLRIANAANSDTCCAVIDVTSASYGSTAIGGRNPRRRSTSGARVGSVVDERVERIEVELGAEQPPHDDFGALVERLDVDAAGRLGDPDLAAVHDAVQPAFVPEVREIAAANAVSRSRSPKVVWLK